MKKKFSNLALIFSASFVLISCANTHNNKIMAGGLEIHDPLENLNRGIFAFNEVVDDALINPIIEGYRTVVPEPGRRGVKNFLRNIKSPITFANQLLQGDIDGAGKVFVRAVVNTLVGLGGIFDVAGYEGMKYESEDFGQTLGVWGVGHGPYLVVPFLGPSSLRDYTGYVVDSFADPLRWYLHNIDREELYYVKLGADYLDLRTSLIDVLQDLESSSIDYYATVRSTYYQNRDALMQDRLSAIEASVPAFPEYDDNF
ncbi:MAG: VacJ family lipoprotein [Alphaproteobacteria bacterium]|nr:VacJ family lipoprotein [Alphaproteobacteria bacterium]